MTDQDEVHSDGRRTDRTETTDQFLYDTTRSIELATSEMTSRLVTTNRARVLHVRRNTPLLDRFDYTLAETYMLAGMGVTPDNLPDYPWAKTEE